MVGLVLLVFMLISYVVLPAQQTRSHYLSVCLVISIMMISIGFTIPLGARPDQCYNEITPNDMYTSNACAWGGAFILAGGLTADLWIFIRALSMNLQICWDIVPGRKFFYVSQLVGWGIPAVLFTITITLTGVSFRFGNACHINHKDSMGAFWGPLLAFAGAAGLLQLGTFGYCIHVYLKNLWSDDTSDISTNASANGLPSYSASVRTQTARAVYRRLKKVLWLQWRGICIVTIILVDVIFFSIVFVSLDGMQSRVFDHMDKVKPWLVCLAANPTDKNQCLDLVQGWLVNEPTVGTVLLLLSLAGLQVFLLLTRPSIFPEWWNFIRSKLSSSRRREEFVSLDAKPEIMRSNSKATLLNYQRGVEATTFEMQTKPALVDTLDLDAKNLSPSLSSPSEAYRSPLQRDQSPVIDFSRPRQERRPSPLEYHSKEASSAADSPGMWTHHHHRPGCAREGSGEYITGGRRDSDDCRHYPAASNFSRPIAPSRQASVNSISFDAREPHSRAGIGLKPPCEAGESQEDVSKMYHWR